MIRQTSINCYNQIKANGLLSKKRFEVYEALCNLAPCTSAEALSTMLSKNSAITSSRARFTELRELGVIYEKGTKKCSVTGINAIEWDLTDNLPIKKENKPIVTKKQKIQEILDEISDFGKTLSNEQDKIILRSIYLKIKSI
jgi:hypothetical protein